MTTTAPVTTVTEPGIYPDMPDEIYHSDPVPGGSLSSSGARKLLPPSCPALFREWRAAKVPSKAQQLGTAAHKLLLGTGPRIVVVDADDWKTNAAQRRRDTALADGRVPLLLKDYARVREMARVLRAHPKAGPIFTARNARTEQSLFWVDQEFGMWRRARLDLFLPGSSNTTMIVCDYKSASAVDDASMAKSMASWGYHQQGAWYVDGAGALGLVPPSGIVFLLVFQMSDPPYLVRVAQPDMESIQWGRVRNRAALSVYRRCSLTGEWPGYGPGTVRLSLPRWSEYQHEADWEAGLYDVTAEESG